jgi:hypothetical protein
MVLVLVVLFEELFRLYGDLLFLLQPKKSKQKNAAQDSLKAPSIVNQT